MGMTIIENILARASGRDRVSADDTVVRIVGTQGAEVSADFTTFEFDDLCGRFLSEHGTGEYVPSVPDKNAVYAEVRPVDLGTLEPYVARPGRVSGNALPVSGVEDRRVDQCFVGSCANGPATCRISATTRYA